MRPWAEWLAVRRMGWLIKLLWLLLIIPTVFADWFCELPEVIRDAIRNWRLINDEIDKVRAQHNLREAA